VGFFFLKGFCCVKGGGKWEGLLLEEIYIRVGSGLSSLIGEVWFGFGCKSIHI